jgi:6-pyruvoyltetrahydropterin/6-carboxytetrahydropterin synthase
MRLTRRYRFSASHRLHSHLLSQTENQRVYGKCNNPYGHGHDYVLEVRVRGPLDETTGRIVDLETLDGLVAEQVISAFEHRDLNTELEAFRDLPPTTENLAVVIQQRLRESWPGAFRNGSAVLDRIRIEETKRNSIELE